MPDPIVIVGAGAAGLATARELAKTPPPFVGHNYDSRGGLLNIGLDASLAARRLERHVPR